MPVKRVSPEEARDLMEKEGYTYLDVRSIPEFEALAESVSGRDLDGFFDAWLHQPTPPAKTAANGF